MPMYTHVHNVYKTMMIFFNCFIFIFALLSCKLAILRNYTGSIQMYDRDDTAKTKFRFNVHLRVYGIIQSQFCYMSINSNIYFQLFLKCREVCIRVFLCIYSGNLLNFIF